MGPSGVGKTTVARLLSERLGWRFAEADEFHPKANIDKMSAGIALQDEDRWPWLRLIRDWVGERAGEANTHGQRHKVPAYQSVLAWFVSRTGLSRARPLTRTLHTGHVDRKVT